MSDTEDIRRYWNDQAEALGTDPRATTPDYWLREIEIANISRILAEVQTGCDVLDIGCGNGYSTLRLAEEHPRHRFVGGDFAAVMIEYARASRQEAPPEVADRVRFQEMDVLAIGATSEFDVVVSDRCLINLPSFEQQSRALDQIAAALKAGGTYVAVENFLGAHENFNAQREVLGLDPIPLRWHNTYLDEAQFLAYADTHFDLDEILAISSTYYLVTRLVYSKLCQIEGVEPTYDDPIYEIATKLPALGDLGPIKLVKLNKRT
jgi:SAM-dependent methyltransferase